MTAPQDLHQLVPWPGALVAVVEQLVSCPWPRSDEDRDTLFGQLEFVSGGPFAPNPDESTTKLFALATALPGDVHAGWVSHEGHFLGINLQPYTSMQPDNPATHRGYDEVRSRLTSLYGEATDVWDSEETPPCTWTVNGRVITMHLFSRRHSGMMLSVDDAELGAAADAAASAAAKTRVLTPELVTLMKEEAPRRTSPQQ
ncbi:MAG: hypothetical protein WBX27_21200 [Specibacter sp.]